MTQQKAVRERDNGLKTISGEASNDIITRDGIEDDSLSFGEGAESDHDVDQIILSGFFDQLRGVIGRYPDRGQEFVFEFDEIRKRDVHMMFVRRSLEVEWYRGDDLVCTRALSPWVGYHSEPADRVIERRPGENDEH